MKLVSPDPSNKILNRGRRDILLSSLVTILMALPPSEDPFFIARPWEDPDIDRIDFESVHLQLHSVFVPGMEYPNVYVEMTYGSAFIDDGYYRNTGAQFIATREEMLSITEFTGNWSLDREIMKFIGSIGRIPFDTTSICDALTLEVFNASVAIKITICLMTMVYKAAPIEV